VGWYELLDIYREARDPTLRGDDIEAQFCPNDGEPLREGPHGELYCPFDGYRPEIGGARRESSV
jgi:uncharacterized Zn finger protein (UPF0148 family)